jgi:hypothetical protein
MVAQSGDVLRDKYLDYCSAQLADLLLYLSPDEIYLLAHREARESDDPGVVSYDRMVRLATRYLQSKIVLPPYEVWVEDYRAHPDRYEEYLMGLWEDAAPLEEV